MKLSEKTGAALEARRKHAIATTKTHRLDNRV